jgi:external thioesterase TEII
LRAAAPGAEFEALVDHYEAALDEAIEAPYVLFGHSLGGLAAFRLAQRLERRGRAPRAVVISGIGPPGTQPDVTWATMDDNEILANVASLGGTPPELLEHPEFSEYLCAVLRADGMALASFADVDPSTVAAPVHLFAGCEDDAAPPDVVAQWIDRIGGARLHVFDGPHLFVTVEAARVAETLDSILSA